MLQEQFATNFYFDRTFKCEAAKILPGEYFYTSKDMLITTVLGSCVSACVRDRLSGVGGMNHFMLPDGGRDDDTPLSASMRYGTYAMEVLINELLKAGARRENLEAKVFGGGNVLESLISTNVGWKNAQFVKEFLAAEKIRIVAEDLNDVFPRKVVYFPKTGKALVRKLKTAQTIISGERDYAKKLLSKPVSGEIELF